MTPGEIYFTITIDTEADHTADWTKSDPLTFRSVLAAIPDRLEPLFKRCGAVGTYLLAVEVLEDDEAVKAMRSLGNSCELGTHLHPEYVDPGKRYLDYAGTYSTDFANLCEAGEEHRKLTRLTRLFEERIGRPPRSYRGGKFGFDDETASSLAELGYLVDTSVTPCVSWRDIGGPDFRKSPDQPYFTGSKDEARGILEVPVSITFLNRIARLLNTPTWLRPSLSEFRAMRRLIDNFLARYGTEGPVVLNMMFHSMEFHPGASPYSKDEDACARLLKRLGDVLRYSRDIGAKFCRLSELRKLYAATAQDERS
jgi:hypothetical protein